MSRTLHDVRDATWYHRSYVMSQMLRDVMSQMLRDVTDATWCDVTDATWCHRRYVMSQMLRDVTDATWCNRSYVMSQTLCDVTDATWCHGCYVMSRMPFNAMDFHLVSSMLGMNCIADIRSVLYCKAWIEMLYTLWLLENCQNTSGSAKGKGKCLPVWPCADLSCSLQSPPAVPQGFMDYIYNIYIYNKYKYVLSLFCRQYIDAVCRIASADAANRPTQNRSATLSNTKCSYLVDVQTHSIYYILSLSVPWEPLLWAHQHPGSQAKIKSSTNLLCSFWMDISTVGSRNK